jgi:hypothetical protein
MRNFNENLKAKVIAVNRVNAAVQLIHPIFIEKFIPFIGQKIFKANGETLLEKVKKVVPEFSTPTSLQLYQSHSKFTLCWVVKTSEKNSEFCCLYHEQLMYIGEIKDGVLTKLVDPITKLRTDYTVEEIEHKQETARKYKDLYEQARDECYPFNE